MVENSDIVMHTFSLDVGFAYKNNDTKNHTRTLDKLLQLMEINNVIQQHESKPQLLVIALIESFIVTAKSVTQVMQKEYHDSLGFCDWYKQKQNEMVADKDMLYFADLRNLLAHEKNLEILRRFKIIPSKPIIIPKNSQMNGPIIQYQQNGNFIVIDNNIRINNEIVKDIELKIELQYFFPDKKELEVRWLCVNHFMKLSKVVDECTKKIIPIYKEQKV